MALFWIFLGLYPKRNSHTSEHWDTWCYRNPEAKLNLHPQSPTAPCFTCFTSMQKRKTAFPLLFQNPCKPKFLLEPSESGSLCRELAVPWDSYPKDLEELFQQLHSDFRCSYCHRSWLLMWHPRGRWPGSQELKMPLHSSPSLNILNKRERVVSSSGLTAAGRSLFQAVQITLTGLLWFLKSLQPSICKIRAQPPWRGAERQPGPSTWFLHSPHAEKFLPRNKAKLPGTSSC